MSVGIVLGAGGPLGWAYHLGVVQGVRDAIGREPANADRVVGTSAGGAIAATLLAGVPTDEVIELISTPPSEADRERLKSNSSRLLREPVQALRPVAPGLLRCVRHVGTTTAIAGLLPAGLFPTGMIRQFATTPEWPAQLWIPSVRLDDGRTIVFGRDQTPSSVADALEATSAIPGVFEPKTIDGARYVDGAVASSTHADILVNEQLDVILISAPSARNGGGPLRARARRSLENENESLRAAGSRTRVLAPDDTVLRAAAGFPRKRPQAAADIVEAARRQTVAAFNDPALHP
jgi:NTE family protein